MNKMIAAGVLSLGGFMSTSLLAQTESGLFPDTLSRNDIDSIRTMSGPLPFGSGLNETRPVFLAQNGDATMTTGTGTTTTTTTSDAGFPALMSPDTVSGTTTGTTTGATGPTFVQNQTLTQDQQSNVATDLVPDPGMSTVAISGTVRFTSEDSFVVEYDEGSVRVQMTDWTWYDDTARTALAGSPVRVYGELTDGIFQEQVIEAQSLYVQNLGTYFHANNADTRDAGFSVETPVEPSTIEMKGTVNTVEQTTFTIDMDQQQVTVDVASLQDNPLDDQGFQQIRQGDQVIVEAPLFANFFENKWLQATSVITLRRDETRQSMIGVSAETTGEGTTPAISDDTGTDGTDGTTDDSGTTGAFGTDPDAEPFEAPESDLP